MLYSTWQHWGAFTAVRVMIIILTCQIAYLLFYRKRNLISTDWRELVVIFPALIGSAYIFHLAGPPANWPWLPTVLYLLGGAFTGLSFFFLSDNFGIRPALRGLADRGPYAYLRHPAYLGEIIMMLACLLAAPAAWSVLVFATICVGQVIRIYAEERVLRKAQEYVAYQNRVAYRLFPFIW